MKCDFCNKEFKSISSLNYHQRTAKYSIEIQGKDIGEEYKCEYCFKIMSRSDVLQKHINLYCKVKMDNENINQNIQNIQNIQTNQTNQKILTETIQEMKILDFNRFQ